MDSLKNVLPTVKEPTNGRRKRLGQFFTGSQLARLLAAIAGADQAKSVIDPMCGTGDMLRAVAELNPNAGLTGIEIDYDILKHAQIQLNNLQRVNLMHGSAFDHVNLKRMQWKEFDLVITNPPYVRYQYLSHQENDGDMPSALKIRKDLFEAANHLLVEAEDRKLFCELIQSYSGLSDLAVPSWILSSMLTKVGGTLALVVPESWLSRDYARIVQYILLRWFKILYIVEDSNASWFSNALVKTTLLVAERINRRSSVSVWDREVYAHVRLSAKTINAISIVGNIYPGATFPEKKFDFELKSLLLKESEISTPLWSVESRRLSEKAENLLNSVKGESWFQKCESLNGSSINGVVLPVELRRWISDGERKDLVSLEQIGAAVGQGLRTGANSFFYVDFVREDKSHTTVAPNRAFGIETVRVHKNLLKPVLRKQSELPNGYQIKKSSLQGRVLVLPKNELTGEILDVIHVAEKTKMRGKAIPELSAVRTNVRRTDYKGNPISNWYSLPRLTHRHQPILLVPRVNGSLPRTYLNDSGLVVDANFSTIWLTTQSDLTRWALLAILNSTWSVACMELIGSVMGAGALKLEATHLKKIPLPNFTKDQIIRLDTLGYALVQSESSSTLKQIDELIVEMFFEKDIVQNKLDQLKKIVQRRLEERSQRT